MMNLYTIEKLLCRDGYSKIKKRIYPLLQYKHEDHVKNT